MNAFERSKKSPELDQVAVESPHHRRIPQLSRSQTTSRSPPAVQAPRLVARLRPPQVIPMSKRTRNLPAMMTELTLSSWETIFHRSLLMAQGTCSVAEYQRMVMEKAAA